MYSGYFSRSDLKKKKKIQKNIKFVMIFLTGPTGGQYGHSAATRSWAAKTQIKR